MNWWLPHNFELKKEGLLKRAAIIKTLRNHFDMLDFVEIDTPALQICPVMDAHIHAFKTQIRSIDLTTQKDIYLHTSPELDMKKLITAGMTRIYQICHVYRNAEGSKLHTPEFTLLEWYRAGANYHNLMDDCVDILRSVAEMLGLKTYTYMGITSNPFTEWQRLSVVEAFHKYSDIDLLSYLNDLRGFANAASDINIRVTENDKWDDIFHAIMAEKIEPYLGAGAPTILYDYPVSMAALSRRKKDDLRFAERFELYICGIELANAYSELTDPIEQRARYEQEMRLKKELYGEAYPPDEEFFKALEHGMPQSAGIALGVDRLIMLATGADNINDVQWVPLKGITAL